MYKVLQGSQYKKVVCLDDFPGFAVSLEEMDQIGVYKVLQGSHIRRWCVVECRKDFMTISYMDTILLHSSQRNPVLVRIVGNHDIQ